MKASRRKVDPMAGKTRRTSKKAKSRRTAKTPKVRQFTKEEVETLTKGLDFLQKKFDEANDDRALLRVERENWEKKHNAKEEELFLAQRQIALLEQKLAAVENQLAVLKSGITFAQTQEDHTKQPGV